MSDRDDGNAVSSDGRVGKRVEQGTLPDKAIRVFEFLTELQRLRMKVIRTLDSYSSVQWLADLPEDPRIITPLSAHSEDSTIWIAVDRVERDEPPAPPTW